MNPPEIRAWWLYRLWLNLYTYVIHTELNWSSVNMHGFRTSGTSRCSLSLPLLISRHWWILRLVESRNDGLSRQSFLNATSVGMNREDVVVLLCAWTPVGLTSSPVQALTVAGTALELPAWQYLFFPTLSVAVTFPTLFLLVWRKRKIPIKLLGC